MRSSRFNRQRVKVATRDVTFAVYELCHISLVFSCPTGERRYTSRGEAKELVSETDLTYGLGKVVIDDLLFGRSYPTNASQLHVLDRRNDGRWRRREYSR